MPRPRAGTGSTSLPHVVFRRVGRPEELPDGTERGHEGSRPVLPHPISPMPFVSGVGEPQVRRGAPALRFRVAGHARNGRPVNTGTAPRARVSAYRGSNCRYNAISDVDGRWGHGYLGSRLVATRIGGPAAPPATGCANRTHIDSWRSHPGARCARERVTHQPPEALGPIRSRPAPSDRRRGRSRAARRG
jgi:hypothetical protein